MALYKYVANALNSGNIFVPDSINYRSLEDELIPFKIWENNGEYILCDLSDCINTVPIKELLQLLKIELQNKGISRINYPIKTKENNFY